MIYLLEYNGFDTEMLTFRTLFNRHVINVLFKGETSIGEALGGSDIFALSVVLNQGCTGANDYHQTNSTVSADEL